MKKVKYDNKRLSTKYIASKIGTILKNFTGSTIIAIFVISLFLDR